MAGPGAEQPDDGGQVAAPRLGGSGDPEDEEGEEEEEPSFFADRKRLIQTGFVVLLLIAGIYFLLPSVVGLEDALDKLKRANEAWIAVALAFNLLAFGSYVALFRGVIADASLQLTWRESYQITMAGLAATRLFSTGGAGGIVLTYWALRKAGMPRRQSACRMVAFLVLLYAVYMLALVVCGVLLRTGVLNGYSPVGLTIIPAALAGVVIVIFLAIALLPHDLERRMQSSLRSRFGKLTRRLATVPATLASGTRTAIEFVRNPSRGGLAIAGAVGFWAANIGILWAGFHAFGVEVALGVVIQGFFIGMVANLIPFVPGGVGAVDAGMIGTFVLFDVPASDVFAAVLVYRLIAFWLPIPPGIVAFVQLRRTVARWGHERRGAPANTSESEVDWTRERSVAAIRET